MNNSFQLELTREIATEALQDVQAGELESVENGLERIIEIIEN